MRESDVYVGILRPEAMAKDLADPVRPTWTPYDPQVDERAVAKVRRLCASLIPESARDEVRLEVGARGNAITIVERRPLWHGPPDAEWTSMKIAQFRCDSSEQLWRLYWADRNGRWNEVRDVEPSPSIDPLLAEVDQDPTAVFWG
jgi:hypothetical protein